MNVFCCSQLYPEGLGGKGLGGDGLGSALQDGVSAPQLLLGRASEKRIHAALLAIHRSNTSCFLRYPNRHIQCAL
jgi:hypothetical protein